ncbi:MAG TPA: hypothetical protein VF720_15500 [Candidatus Eisenbacteria bacterium]
MTRSFLLAAAFLAVAGCSADEDDPAPPPCLVGCWEATNHDARVDFRCYFEDGTGYFVFGDTCWNTTWASASDTTVRVESCWFIDVHRFECTENGNLLTREWGRTEYRRVASPGCNATIPAEENCQGPDNAGRPTRSRR